MPGRLDLEDVDVLPAGMMDPCCRLEVTSLRVITDS